MKRHVAEEPTTPETRPAIARLAAAALQRIDELAPIDEAGRALYLSAPHPCALDRAIRPLVDGLRVLDGESRASLAETPLSRAQSQTLALFAERMAYLATHTREDALVFDGLIAAAFLDRREGADTLLRLLGKLYQSALELGAEPLEAFRRAARLARPHSTALFESFARRTAPDRIR